MISKTTEAVPMKKEASTVNMEQIMVEMKQIHEKQMDLLLRMEQRLRGVEMKPKPPDLEEIPIFKGRDVEVWILRTEHYLDTGNYIESDKLKVVRRCFEDEALLWYRWERDRNPFKSWEDMKQRIREQFSQSPVCPYEKHITMKQRQDRHTNILEKLEEKLFQGGDKKRDELLGVGSNESSESLTKKLGKTMCDRVKAGEMELNVMNQLSPLRIDQREKLRQQNQAMENYIVGFEESSHGERRQVAEDTICVTNHVQMKGSKGEKEKIIKVVGKEKDVHVTKWGPLNEKGETISSEELFHSVLSLMNPMKGITAPPWWLLHVDPGGKDKASAKSQKIAITREKDRLILYEKRKHIPMLCFSFLATLKPKDAVTVDWNNTIDDGNTKQFVTKPDSSEALDDIMTMEALGNISVQSFAINLMVEYGWKPGKGISCKDIDNVLHYMLLWKLMKNQEALDKIYFQQYNYVNDYGDPGISSDGVFQKAKDEHWKFGVQGKIEAEPRYKEWTIGTDFIAQEERFVVDVHIKGITKKHSSNNQVTKKVSSSNKSKNTFGEFGKMTDGEVIKDGDGESRRHDFVNLGNVDDVAKVVEFLSAIIVDGEEVIVTWEHKDSKREREPKVWYKKLNEIFTNLYFYFNLEDKVHFEGRGIDKSEVVQMSILYTKLGVKRESDKKNQSEKVLVVGGFEVDLKVAYGWNPGKNAKEDVRIKEFSKWSGKENLYLYLAEVLWWIKFKHGVFRDAEQRNEDTNGDTSLIGDNKTGRMEGCCSSRAEKHGNFGTITMETKKMELFTVLAYRRITESEAMTYDDVLLSFCSSHSFAASLSSSREDLHHLLTKRRALLLPKADKDHMIVDTSTSQLISERKHIVEPEFVQEERKRVDSGKEEIVTEWKKLDENECLRVSKERAGGWNLTGRRHGKLKWKFRTITMESTVMKRRYW